jgi:hypothetical protein
VRLATAIAATAAACVLFVVSVVLHFAHPHLTDTEVLVEYWPVYAGLVAAVAVAGVMLRSLDRR